MYGKLFASCFTGSMSGSGPQMFAVWAYILANADSEGCLELNPKIMAVAIGMTTDEVKAVIERLQQPDPDSRSKDQEGKRLIKSGEFFYQIVNYDKYRQMQTARHRNDYMKKYMHDKRILEKAKNSIKNDVVNCALTDVSNVSRQVEVEAKVEVEENNTYIHTRSKNSQNQHPERLNQIKEQCKQILKTD
jgi:hypothetical protein